jgi:hypothetical protein
MSWALHIPYARYPAHDGNRWLLVDNNFSKSRMIASYNSAAASITKTLALPATRPFILVALLGWTIGVSDEVAVGTITAPVLDTVPMIWEAVPTEVGGMYVEVEESEEEDVEVVALWEV